MSVDVTFDPKGPKFIKDCLAQNKFLTQGYVTGRHGRSLHYVVIDPNRHELFVWRKKGGESTSYSDTAAGLGAVAFSNGPMMEGYKTSAMVKKLIAKRGWWGLAMALGSVALVTVLRGKVKPHKALMVLAALASTVGATVMASFIEWLKGAKPFNKVIGTKRQISDTGVGHNHTLAWFGRKPKPPGFRAYSIRLGPPGTGQVEVIGGLIPLILGRQPQTNNAHVKDLEQSNGAVVWALVPDLSPPQLGVVVVMGKVEYGFSKEATARLLSMGASDAVAMDGSNSNHVGFQVRDLSDRR